MKFDLGKVYVTRGVNEKTQKNFVFGAFVIASLQKHHNGDWGDLCDEDKETNEWSLKNGERLLSKYDFDENTSIYIITEWDRSVTTILFPDEY